MALNTPHELAQTWGGHQPILKALMQHLEPNIVVECGCGNFSTPICQEAIFCLSVEHDPKWAESVRSSFGKRGDSSCRAWFVHEISGAYNGTKLDELTPAQKHAIDRCYARIADDFTDIDLLFVDTFTAARPAALIHLGPLAQVIVLHDTEYTSPAHYRYGLADDVLREMHHYSYRPEGQTAEGHRYTWTDVFSREPLDAIRLASEASANAIALWGQAPELIYLGKGPTGWPT
jgi:hypothetical protein